MKKYPIPIEVDVCSICGELWDLHLQFALHRLHADDDDDDYDLIAKDTDVTLEDCVRALKRRNQGPMGPPGPMGAMGMSG